MRKRVCLFLALFVVLALASCTSGSYGVESDVSEEVFSEETFSESAEISGEESTVKSTSPLLWNVTNEETGAVVWLFGSCDYVDEKAFPLPDAVMSAYESSGNLIVLSASISSISSARKALSDC